MENPFLRINKSNKILRFGILIVIGISIILMFMLNSTLSEAVSSQNSFLNWKSDKDKEIENLKKQIQEKELELKKYTSMKEVIRSQIIEHGVSEKVADNYAVSIIRESNKRGQSPFIQTALLQSESSFQPNIKHDLDGVVGMGGIYWNVWKDELKREKIAYSKEQLKNPYVSIKASSYILSCYMGDCKNITKEALAHYKGYSVLGKKQADNVIKIASNLKRKVENVRGS